MSGIRTHNISRDRNSHTLNMVSSFHNKEVVRQSGISCSCMHGCRIRNESCTSNLVHV
jgi:hypothetical protein